MKKRMNWQSSYIFTETKKGRQLKRIVPNAQLVLINDRELGGMIGHDTFRDELVWRRDCPHIEGFPALKKDTVWNPDSHWTYVAYHLERVPGVVSTGSWGREQVCQAVLSAARCSFAFNPLQEFMNSIRGSWDGKPRVNSWLTDYMGCAPTDYTQKVGRWWMISAVARAFRPGAQVDHALVLQGPQGARKSTAVKILAVHPDWSTNRLPDLKQKDAMQQLKGAWLVELEEMIGPRLYPDVFKSFLTATTDHYRPTYEKGFVKSGRQCVFIGTTNEALFLNDATGNRRYWPVVVNNVKVDALEKDVLQLWAEALDMYTQHERWWPSTVEEAAMLNTEQGSRNTEDPWEPIIGNFLRNVRETSMNEILEHLRIDMAKRGRSEATRVGNIMTNVYGWEKHDVREQGTRRRNTRYTAPEEPSGIPG